MSRALPPVCAECPFSRPGYERDYLKARVDHGCWVPCKRSAAPTFGLDYHDRITAWAAEEECAGARAWRRDKALPTGAAQ